MAYLIVLLEKFQSAVHAYRILTQSFASNGVATSRWAPWMCRHSPQIFVLSILIAPFRDSLAAPIYVGSVELILRVAVIAPLLLLLLLGAGIGGLRGAAVGFAIYLFGLAALFVIGTASEAVRMHEVSNRTIAWSDACLIEAGEIGPTSSLRAEKVFVVVDQRIRKFWAPLRFDEKRTYPQVEFVHSSPETIAPEQALVSIRLIDRPVKGAGDWRIQGYETTVSDSKRNIVAKRTNLVRVSDGCFREVEEVGIQRFLLRIVGIAPYPSTDSNAEVAATPVAYPIAAVTGPETGRYEVGKGIGVGAYIPPEWDCIFENDLRGHPTFAKCPGPDGKPMLST